MIWSIPYCGVTHLKGVKQGYQITVTTFGTGWSEVYVLHGLITIADAIFEGPENEARARAWGEERGTSLGVGG